MMKIKWRKFNRAIHRDLGYFFFAMSVIYGISGVAINHIKDWNPNYDISSEQVDFGKPVNRNITKAEVIEFLKNYGEEENYKKHYFPNQELFKIFLDGGSVLINIYTGQGEIEKIQRRPILHQVNYLHYNPKKWWTWFSDAYAVALVVLAVTGLFILKGKNGITQRGAWLTIAGILVPIAFLILYY
ncbi:MAG: PepSY-associated TM helix domain-containing protein [Bacteroidales bacterium]|nr:PepSY-associated TM helix domain-containing protein [Bacteroidales bacterium]